MATERIQIIISSKGGVTVKREIDEIGKSSKRSADGVDMFKRALGTIAAFMGVQQLIAYSDAATRLGNQLRLTGLSGEAFAATQDRVYSAAIRNGQQAELLGTVYQKLSASSNDLGLKQTELMSTVEGIAAAMKLSTAGTAAQAGALQQLSQLFGGAVVQAQEYNSLIDGAYPLVQAAARGIDGMGGSVGKLTAKIKEGGFSTRVFLEGLRKGLEDTKALADSIPLTIGQSFVSLQQAFQQWLATSETANWSASMLATTLQWLATNIDYVVLAVGALGAAMVLNAGVNGVMGLYASLVTLAAAIRGVVVPAFLVLQATMYANPLLFIGGAIVVGITAIIALMYQWRDSLGVVGEWFDWLGEKAAQVLGWIREQLEAIGIFSDGKLEVELKGDNVAKQLMDAHSKGGANAGKSVYDAHAKGGAAAARTIEQEALAKWEALNGKAVQQWGTVFVKGGELMYNKVTGAVQQAAPQLNNAVKTGGEHAGQSMATAIQGAGQSAASSIEIAGIKVSGAIADAMSGFVDQIFAMMKLAARAENITRYAAAGKDRAEAEKLRAEAEKIRRYGMGGGGSSGGGGGGGGSSEWVPRFNQGGAFSSTSETTGVDNTPVKFLANRNEREKARAAYEQRANDNSANNNVPEVNVPLTIENMFDPRMMIAALQSAEGRRIVKNIIADDRDEVSAILGRF